MKTFFDYNLMLTMLSVLLVGYGSPTQAQTEQLSPEASAASASNRCQPFTYSWHTASKDKPQLGVMLKGSAEGVVILKTFPNSAASEAGLQADDQILSINGKKVNTIEELQAAIQTYKVGESIAIQYQRNGAPQSVNTTLKATSEYHYLNHRKRFYKREHHNDYSVNSIEKSENPCETIQKIEGKPFLGVYLNGAHNFDKDGSEITSIIKGTQAEKAKLHTADKIIRLNDQVITTTEEAIEYIKSKKPGDKVRITLIREGKTKRIRATIGSFADHPTMERKIAILSEKCELNAPEEPKNPNTEDNRSTTSSNLEIENGLSMTVFPNPTTDFITVEYKGPKAPLTVSIITLEGKELSTKTITDFAGNYQEQIDLSNYPAGTYFINFRQGEEQISRQVIVE